MASACGPAASQSRIFDRIAPRRVARSAASTGRGLPVTTSTSLAPIARAWAIPRSSRAWAASSPCPCRSSEKSGSITPDLRRLSQCESKPPEPIGRDFLGSGTGALFGGGGGTAFAGIRFGGALAAKGGAAPAPALGKSRFTNRAGSIGCTEAATRAHASASSAVSPRGGFTVLFSLA